MAFLETERVDVFLNVGWVYMVQRRPTPPHPPCGWVMVPPAPCGCGAV